MDEWITLENATYANAGIWMKVQDKETIERLSDMNNGLLPETGLTDFFELEIEHSGMLNIEGVPYYFIESTMREEQGVQVRTQIWIEQNSQLIRKIRVAGYENKALMGELITTFAEHFSDLSISAPDGVNSKYAAYCVVEHW